MKMRQLHALAIAAALALLTLATVPAPAIAQVADSMETNAAWSAPLPFKSRAEEVRFQKLTGQLRCLVCQDESLADSEADLAKQMRYMIFQQMQHGWSNDRIKQYLVDRYSAYVLYKPPLKPGTWLLWFGPAIILLIGAGVVVAVVRKRHAVARHMEPHELADASDDDW